MSVFDDCRGEFPALQRQINGKAAVYFDGPAGSQVPRRVVEAVSNHLLHHNANHGGAFATSRESDAILDAARQQLALFLNTPDPDTIVFGANMTTLTFALSRALAATWKAGDEIVVTRLDHDANVSPWVRAAHERDVAVRHVEVNSADCTLDLDDLAKQLCGRTRLVAVGCVSNAVGTRNPIPDIVKMAHAHGALVFLDAVHLAPHGLIDVALWQCDFLACSAYKFFGPHVGVLWGRRELLEKLPAYKVRPCPETVPDRWMTGTQNFAAIAGVKAAVEYLFDMTARLAGHSVVSRASLVTGMRLLEEYERQLSVKLLAGLSALPDLKVWGITDPARAHERVPTFSFTHRRHKPLAIAEYLGSQGIFCWHGNFYALPLTEALQVEPEGMVRVGLLHYNTFAEIDRLVHALGELSGAC